jgi:alginate O-acetyltransferase complex protein AlgI
MLFNTIEFLLFFPIVTILFYLLPSKFRWIHLLTASCFFYMFFIPQYILILFITILIDYYAGIKIEQVPTHRKKLYLIASIIATCLVLFIFKYFNFFNQNINSLSSYFGFSYSIPLVKIILPIGLSFHTFQSLSYVIEVYKGKQKAEHHFGVYSLYVMFYPQLVTGPIERPQNLLRQLREKQKYNYSNIIEGLRLILFGLFLKMVVADSIAEYVDTIYANVDQQNSLSVWIAIFLYSFQIYCDFYGYSTIAIGAAKTMGFSLMDNFKNPYLAKSISEFWQRWHISLSTWFRDYIYFSLGGNRVKIYRWMINILIVFTVSGLWHGASWTFIAWGAAHGILYIIEFGINKIVPTFTHSKIISFIKIIFIFLIVSLIWVLFRATDFTQAIHIYKAAFNNLKLVQTVTINPIIWISLLVFIILDTLLFNSRFDFWCRNQHTLIRWTLYSCMIFGIIVFSSVADYPFIYFQF